LDPYDPQSEWHPGTYPPFRNGGPRPSFNRTDDFWRTNVKFVRVRRVELGYKQAAGAPKARIDFKSWDLAPRIADGTFTFHPGEAAKQIAFEQFTAGLVSAGDPTSPAASGPSAPGAREQ